MLHGRHRLTAPRDGRKRGRTMSLGMRRCLTALLALLLAWPFPAREAERYDHRLDVAALTRLGRALFFDPGLSASGTTSCASCHDPRMPSGRRTRCRCSPPAATGARRACATRPRCATCRRCRRSASTSSTTTATTASTPARPAATCGTAARAPATSRRGCRCCRRPRWPTRRRPRSSRAAHAAPTAAALRALFGDDVFDDARASLRRRARWRSRSSSSRRASSIPTRASTTRCCAAGPLDAAGGARPGALQRHGKGNCASAIASERAADGAFPLFTDFGHVALGVPRNRALAGQPRPDVLRPRPVRPAAHRPARRTTTTAAFPHADAAQRGRCASPSSTTASSIRCRRGRFYARRDTHPAAFYPRRGAKFDDLPGALPGQRQYRSAVRPPPGGRARPRRRRDRRPSSPSCTPSTDADLAR